jgi:Sec-independent protein translocase protein TatA
MLRKAGLIVNELKTASRELRNQVTEEVRDLERTVGSVKTPQVFMKDLGRDLTEEIGSPYDEIYKTEVEAKAEISSIKNSLEEESSSPKTSEAPEEGDTPTEAPESADASKNRKVPS